MIHLSNVCPTPLLETPSGINPASDVFGIDCHFEKGKNYLAAASSGKGKSTLLHIIYGLRKDFEGKLMISGDDTVSWRANDWASLRQRQISIVFQDLRLFPQLTALENLTLKAKLTDTTTYERILEMANQLEMSDFLDQTANTLSYGQRQRIAIIRALCQPFDLLLLDEPFSHLDTKNIELASTLIHEVVSENEAGIIMASLGEQYGFEYYKEYEI